MKTLMAIAVAVLALAGWAIAGIDATQLVASARAQVGVTVGCDPAYRKLPYPGGDVPPETGVCCDVVIRALRRQVIHSGTWKKGVKGPVASYSSWLDSR